jgi:protein associated with RNAse G/E
MTPIPHPAAVGSRVRVVFRKYDGALHWHQYGSYLGADENGDWVGFSGQTRAQRGSEPPIVLAHNHVQLFARSGWWTAIFNAAPHPTSIYCDITTVPDWSEHGIVTMVDLDLDVVRTRDGRTWIDDEDEFLLHQKEMRYSADVIAAARSSADRLLPLVRDAAEPFGVTAAAWLERLD